MSGWKERHRGPRGQLAGREPWRGRYKPTNREVGVGLGLGRMEVRWSLGRSSKPTEIVQPHLGMRKKWGSQRDATDGVGVG